MPSGSRRGIRGSSGSFSRSSSRSFSRSSSRSFSSGSRSSFGGHSRHIGGHYHHHHPIRLRFGRRYYVYSSGTTSGLTIVGVFLFFALIFTLGFGVSRGAAKDELALVEEEYYYYQNMITLAESRTGTYAVVDAKVVQNEYDPEVDKYRLIYELEKTFGFPEEGYTYLTYETSHSINSTIKVAVTNYNIDNETDSIDVNFKYIALEDVGEYQLAKKDLRSANIPFIICILVDVAIIGGTIFYLIKKKEVEEVDSNSSTTQTTSSERYCSYCGSHLDDSVSKCPGCGASAKR